MTITRYRKGQLSIPVLYCPEIDTLTGALNLNSGGVLYAALVSSRISAYQHLRLRTGFELRDNSDGIIIGTDDAGNIDDLARIDCKVTSPADSHVVWASAVDLIRKSQTGTTDEDDGSWTCNANDGLYLYLGALMPVTKFGGNLYIDEITIWFSTGHNDDYITTVRLIGLYKASAVRDTEWNDATDQANGTSGPDDVTYSPNYTLTANRSLQLFIDCIVGNTSVTIYSIQIKYHRV